MSFDATRAPLSLRLNSAEQAALAGLVNQRQHASPGVRLSAASVIRALILEAAARTPAQPGPAIGERPGDEMPANVEPVTPKEPAPPLRVVFEHAEPQEPARPVPRVERLRAQLEAARAAGRSTTGLAAEVGTTRVSVAQGGVLDEGWRGPHSPGRGRKVSEATAALPRAAPTAG